MNRSIAVVSVVWLAVAACGPQEGTTNVDGTWVGTITTEGNVTTVVNESGSVWGGTATLVEEVSIGVESGADEVMFGDYYDLSGLAASANHVYVIDTSVPVVRKYTLDGQFVGNIGREGDGPGEYRYPNGIAISDDGRVFVRDRDRRRVTVYLPGGDYLDTYPMPLMRTGVSFVVTKDGVPFGPQSTDVEWANGEPVLGMVAHGPEGPFGTPRMPPRYDVDPPFVNGPNDFRVRVRHAPDYVWRMTAAGEMIGGASTSYQFTRATADGATIRMERKIEPIPISAQEQDHSLRLTTAFMRMNVMLMDPGAGWTWNGVPNPSTKPAFVRFVPTESGELWVLRSGVSEPIPGCVRTPDDPMSSHCWQDTWILDAFDRKGRYLGEIGIPPGANAAMLTFAQGYMDRLAIVRGDLVILRAQDEAGTTMVKRYRLVLPGEEER